MPVTIYDVAKQAGVGIGTVSRVINKSSQITDKTKERVLAVIKELNYQPHIVAQSLARKRTNTIGCIIPFFTGYFFMELLDGIQRRITQMKNDLILYSVDTVNKKETFLRRAFEERRVDGILLGSLEISEEFVQQFLDKDFPIVLVDGYHPELDSIKVDNIGGAYQATRHLLSLDYNRVAMIDGILTSFPARLRYEGYKKALAEFGHEYDEKYFVQCDFANEADGFNKQAGYVAMSKLLDLGGARPDAVFVSSDIQAVGALKAIKEAKLQVPNDIAVVGFDNIELAEHIGLTTMAQPTFEMGCLAVNRLIDKISGKSYGRFEKRLETKLIIRDSCGAKILRNSF